MSLPPYSSGRDEKEARDADTTKVVACQECRLREIPYKNQRQGDGIRGK